MSAVVKHCPPRVLEKAKILAKKRGQKHFIVLDTVIEEYKVYSQQSWNGLQLWSSLRYELIAIVSV